MRKQDRWVTSGYKVSKDNVQAVEDKRSRGRGDAKGIFRTNRGAAFHFTTSVRSLDTESQE